ncbi:MAG: glycosyltransferase [Bacteroidetes bacterium]|nr:glycosyltransferase [Bacteroidota bacterium]
MIVSSIIWVVFGVTIAYLIIIGVITYGWLKLSNGFNLVECKDEIEVSIVVAVRNESANIQRLINQLIDQNYDPNLYDIIIVDDHSIDNTVEIVEQSISDISGKQIVVISAKGEGKKSALKEGITKSSAKLIITTDGDCSIKTGWITSIVHQYISRGQKIILGPVVYENEKSIIQKLFALDFISLVAAGAGSVGIGLPLMGNGANLAFEREVFLSNEESGKKYTSGDDVFLIHHVVKKYGSQSVGFLLNEAAIVSTNAPGGFNAFLKQRIRWASKATGYQLVWPIIVSLTVFLFNTILFLMLLGSLLYTWLLPIYILIIITKFFIDMPLVFKFLTFSNKGNLKPLFFFMEFIYPIYIVVAAFSSFVFKFEWKGRGELK